jgi:hypothetical protein
MNPMTEPRAFALSDQTAGTTSPGQPITPDEHVVQDADTYDWADHCAKCRTLFDRDDTSPTGSARYGNGPYCHYCVQLCEQAQAFLHLCMICRRR